MVKSHPTLRFRKPVAQHSLDAFKQLEKQLRSEFGTVGKQSLIFDSGCGTGHSTRAIAEQYPDALVIGIDRSSYRLGKQYNRSLPDNARLVRADCVDFWRLARQAGWLLSRHFILYPNPYPKTSHLKRRWHAHPVFPDLLALGGALELRSNWNLYLYEFERACQLAGYEGNGVHRLTGKPDMTLFEKKYHASGYELYRFRVHLTP